MGTSWSRLLFNVSSEPVHARDEKLTKTPAMVGQASGSVSGACRCISSCQGWRSWTALTGEAEGCGRAPSTWIHSSGAGWGWMGVSGTFSTRQREMGWMLDLSARVTVRFAMGVDGGGWGFPTLRAIRSLVTVTEHICTLESSTRTPIDPH
jgi:hypothetical protein